MTEADKAMLLLSLQREMVEMKRKTEEATQNNEQEIQALRRENEEMKKKLMEGSFCWIDQCCQQVLHLPSQPETGRGDKRQGPHP